MSPKARQRTKCPPHLDSAPEEGWGRKPRGREKEEEGVERLGEPGKELVTRPESQEEERRWPGMGQQVGGGTALSGRPCTHPSSYLMQII